MKHIQYYGISQQLEITCNTLPNDSNEYICKLSQLLILPRWELILAQHIIIDIRDPLLYLRNPNISLANYIITSNKISLSIRLILYPMNSWYMTINRLYNGYHYISTKATFDGTTINRSSNYKIGIGVNSSYNRSLIMTPILSKLGIIGYKLKLLNGKLLIFSLEPKVSEYLLIRVNLLNPYYPTRTLVV